MRRRKVAAKRWHSHLGSAARLAVLSAVVPNTVPLPLLLTDLIACATHLSLSSIISKPTYWLLSRSGTLTHTASRIISTACDTMHAPVLRVVVSAGIVLSPH
jgi:hypothetical protein